MRQVFCILFSTIIIVSCGQVNNKKSASDDLKYDTSVIAIIPYDSAYSWNFNFKKPKQIQLTQNDIILIENLIIKSVDAYNNEQEKKYNDTNEKEFRSIKKEYHLIDLTKYKRQYLALNDKGERQVWVNFFCRTDYFPNWKTKLFDVKDGGNCYFNLKINFTKGMYYDFYVNGNG